MKSAFEYPNTAAVAPHLYGSLEEQFGYAWTASRLDARARDRLRPAVSLVKRQGLGDAFELDRSSESNHT